MAAAYLNFLVWLPNPMAKKARKYSVDFKRDAVRQMAEAATIARGLVSRLWGTRITP